MSAVGEAEGSEASGKARSDYNNLHGDTGVCLLLIRPAARALKPRRSHPQVC